jgi:hypothetical protein
MLLWRGQPLCMQHSNSWEEKLLVTKYSCTPCVLQNTKFNYCNYYDLPIVSVLSHINTVYTLSVHSFTNWFHIIQLSSRSECAVVTILCLTAQHRVQYHTTPCESCTAQLTSQQSSRISGFILPSIIVQSAINANVTDQYEAAAK